MAFETAEGLYLLSFIIALILLYLIKQKPRVVKIPSLLFFADYQKEKKYNSILQKLLVRLLFFIQLFFIILLALSAANPHIQVPVDAFSLNTIAIVDVSASMHTREGVLTRIDSRKQDLLNLIKGRTSLILAEENPVLVASNVSGGRARSLVSNLAAKDVSTRLDGAMMLAQDILGEQKGNIIVYSDFAVNNNDDVLAAKKLLEAGDKRVVFIPIGSPKENLGFVNLNIIRGKGEAFVKNYGGRDKAVDVRLDSSERQETVRVQIAANSIERITFDIFRGETKLEILSGDALPNDNTLYVMNPYDRNLRVLLITNNQDSHLLDALEANAHFDVEIAQPPVVPDFRHDVIVVNEVDPSQLLPNMFRDIRKYRDDGGKVVLTSQEDLNQLNLQGLTQFSVGTFERAEQSACTDIVNEYTSRISNPRCFSDLEAFYTLTIGQESVVLASTTEQTPIFVMEQGLFYYGIIDEYAGFKDQIAYPLFWDDVINALLGKKSLANFNYRTGDIYLKTNKSTTLLDTAGFHTLDGERIAVNLLDPVESNIYKESEVINETAFFETQDKVDLDVNLSSYLLFIALLLFLFELYYIKRRGDL
ncbi:hypothetical protein GOV09_03205 [Candidatus Woesearchaeota archaeon]|nr:hypothetical protein [Candidatus Woesearchaeota archaeon]